ncbi:VOC family protein, partial [Bacillus thuringiensis]
MGIKHLNLTVTDVTASREFLERYFGLICSGTRGNAFAVMRDNDGFILTLMKGKEVQYPK